MILQDIINDINYENLDLNWNMFEIPIFSSGKNLYPYQQEAIKNAIKALWKYYQYHVDFTQDENIDTNNERKNKLYQSYNENGLNINLDIGYGKIQNNIRKILSEIYPESGESLSYQEFINRMSFWMATGSGKSLIIIKLIEIIKILIDRNEIPNLDILFLTHRDDLIEQFMSLVREYNTFDNQVKIILKELRELPELKKY